jgi:hypothetical protein
VVAPGGWFREEGSMLFSKTREPVARGQSEVVVGPLIARMRRAHQQQFQQ